MRTLLICHDDAELDRDGLARWLASFSTLAGILVVREPRRRLRQRVAREIRRVGVWRFLDVLAFRALLPPVAASGDRLMRAARARLAACLLPRASGRTRARRRVAELGGRRGVHPRSVSRISCSRDARRCSANASSPSRRSAPTSFIPASARSTATRTAASGPWRAAITTTSGTTLLRIDAGVDTGPVFGYFRVEADPSRIARRRCSIARCSIISTRSATRCGRSKAGRARPIDDRADAGRRRGDSPG